MTTFSFGPILIGNLSQTAGVFIGRNEHVHFVEKGKKNEGQLTVSGTGAKLINNTAIVFDKDILDTK